MTEALTLPIRRLSMIEEGTFFAVGDHSVFVPIVTELDDKTDKPSTLRVDLSQAAYGQPSRVAPVGRSISVEDRSNLQRHFEKEYAASKSKASVALKFG